MSSSKRRRHTSTAAPPPPEATVSAPTLPSDLLLEIVARSDAATLIRCAACCKPLRRDILSPAFIRRVCHGDGAGGAAVVPPRLFGFVPIHNNVGQSNNLQASAAPAAFSLAHPATRAAEHLSEKHLAPLLSRGRGGDQLTACFYEPLTSRNGVVALELRQTSTCYKLGICMYDPMTGDHTFVQNPPDMTREAYVLLTASDGIGCSFILLMAEFAGLTETSCSIRVQSVSSDDAAAGGKWSRVTSVSCYSSQGSYRHPSCSAVVIGGSIHWLMFGVSRWDDYVHVLTYKVGAAAAGRIELPIDRLPESYRKSGEGGVRLASTPDGRLSMLCREWEGLKICVWVLSAYDHWALHVVIDIETPLRSLLPVMPNHSWPCPWIQLESSWERSGLLLLFVRRGSVSQQLIVLDIQTNEMHKVDNDIYVRAIPFEVDLESQLSGMKSF